MGTFGFAECPACGEFELIAVMISVEKGYCICMSCGMHLSGHRDELRDQCAKIKAERLLKEANHEG